MLILREGLNLATAITAVETSSLHLPSCPDVVPSHGGPLVGRLASQIRVLGLGLGLDTWSSSSSTDDNEASVLASDLAPEAAFLARGLDGWRGGGRGEESL